MSSETPTPAVDFLSQRLVFEEFLNTNELRVKFTKDDGTVRTMRCTRNPEMFKHLLPVREAKDTPTVVKKNDKQVRAWDLDAKGWRSFNVDTVIDWAIVGGPDEEAPAINEARWNGVVDDDDEAIRCSKHIGRGGAWQQCLRELGHDGDCC